MACSQLPTSEIGEKVAGRHSQTTATSKNVHKNLLIFSGWQPAVENLLFGGVLVTAWPPAGSHSTASCDEKPIKFEYITVVIDVHGRKRVR